MHQLVHECLTFGRVLVGAKFKRIFFFCSFLSLIFAQIANINSPAYSEAFAAALKSEGSQKTGASDYTSQIQKTAAGNSQTVLPKYSETVRQHAEMYGIDWRLVLAIMKQESNFEKGAVSKRGAYGLMQVMPSTGKEIALRLGFDNLHHPHKNISGGTYYLAKLYDLFEEAPFEDRLRLTLASYNAGPGRIYDAQNVAAYLGENAHSWEAIQKALPLLSKRYYTLHRSVWDGGKPRSGYFGKSRQTILYVQNVLEDYKRYKSMLN